MGAIGNPFRPGAGHMPLWLAGREEEMDQFKRLLQKQVITDNLILTGLRGVGKTVLLDTLKPIAIKDGWLWVGTDLTEATTLSEERVVIRLLADLALITSSIPIGAKPARKIGFEKGASVPIMLTYERLVERFSSTPGLTLDKLKSVLEFTWESLCSKGSSKGVIFAYDEAQNMSDKSEKEEYPLSLMLDTFQSLQKKNIPFMLLLTGLPTLQPKLVEARTFAERMFRVLFLDRLDNDESRDAIQKPIEQFGCEITLEESLVNLIIGASGGYPYFIQFICREVYDAALQRHAAGEPLHVSMADIARKLDTDFFAGRWARATDRQRELLTVVASLEGCDGEFTAREVVEQSRFLLEKPFSASHVGQMFASLSDNGLIYKNRHGRYSFAVPLLGQFIRRQSKALRPA